MIGPSPNAGEPDVMTAMMGSMPPANTAEVEDFFPRIQARGGPVVVLNDEAHHTHDEDSQWNQAIRRLHASLLPRQEGSPGRTGLQTRPEGSGTLPDGSGEPSYVTNLPGGLAAQLDFTATPRHTKGQLFSWTVYDYPLKQAILDNIVKRPLKGIAKGIAEQRLAVCQHPLSGLSDCRG